MKKMCFATALSLIIPAVHAGDGILSRHGADGPISTRYGGSAPISERYGGSGPISERYGGSDPISRRFARADPAPKRAQQDYQAPAEQHEYVNGFRTATGFEGRIQTPHHAPIRSAVVYQHDTLLPSGEGYINARSGRYYPPAGDHAVIDTSNGKIIPIP